MNAPAGRPKIYTEQNDPLRVNSVRLPNWHIRLARKLGDGNLSAGIRIALEMMYINSKETP